MAETVLNSADNETASSSVMPPAPLAEPVVNVRCVVCTCMDYTVLCSAAEIQSQDEYLYRFHRRRLRKTGNGAPPASAFLDRADFTQDYATDIVQCSGCGLLFRNPRPTSGAIVRAYAQDHYGLQRLTALFTSQRELYRTKAQYLRRWLPTGPSVQVLEVGSFVGGFLAAGQSYGWRMCGVDPGREVDAFCQSRGLPVIQSTLPEVALAEASVDCVAIWNTFDQLPDPEPTLSSARRLLRPGGILVVRVPNGACFCQTITWLPRLPRPVAEWLRRAMAWNNLLGFPYLYGYSIATLDRLLTRHGFTRVSVCSDTLPRLADKQTKAWARGEEYALKTLTRFICRMEVWNSRQTLALAPWIDVYYRRVGAEASTEKVRRPGKKEKNPTQGLS